MKAITLTKDQARQFILIKQGLAGKHRFIGKNGIIAFIRQAGCVQFDPIDVCGRNAELVLQSRIKGFTKQMLFELLYEDRRIVDYFDKNLSMIDVCDWKYFNGTREAYGQHGRGHDEVEKVSDSIINMISTNGPMCSKDIGLEKKVDWYWSSTSLSRATLETLYFRGELIVHHKKGSIKYYALAKDFIPKEILSAENPNKTALAQMKWHVLRRISAVGLLWNRPSDAWLCIRDFKASHRNEVFNALLSENKLVEVSVSGIKDKLYCLSDDIWILEQVAASVKVRSRTELIAPLDSMLWDRKLIKELFDFEYKWEIYTPANERKFGYYVLPVLSGKGFIGRTEVICDRKHGNLEVKNLWLEQGVRISKKLCKDMNQCYQRFMCFHGLDAINYSENCRFLAEQNVEEQ